METTARYAGSVLMLSTHGYVAGEPELGRPDTGGQVVFVLELAKQFASMGYRVDVVTRQFEDQPEVDDIGPGLRVWRVPFGGPEFLRKEDMHDHIEDFVVAMVAAIREGSIRYDVINSHYWDAGWAGQRISEELGIPHVHTPHSLGSWKRQGMDGNADELEAFYRFEERIRKEFLVFRRSDHVIATTNQQVELLQEMYDVPERHISMIPPGIDEGRYTPVDGRSISALRRRLQIRQHDVYTVGRAAANKGDDLLIRALPPLRQSIGDARLKLAVGANNDKDRRKVRRWSRLAESLGVADSVSWLSYVPDEEMANYYRAAPIFALPSRYEPFGMTAVEAMACGTPCVVTVHGGLEEMFDFGSHALFADPKRPTEFATMLSMPLRYPKLRERLSIDGARFARRHFGWRNIARRTLSVFDQVRGQYEPINIEPAFVGNP